MDSRYLDERFAVFRYATTQPHDVYVTCGASRDKVPLSEKVFGDARGVRYEMLMHGSKPDPLATCDLLYRAALAPYLLERPIAPGEAIYVNRAAGIGHGSKMTSLYFTYPYEDDPDIYTRSPSGQILTSTSRIQVLWVFPIHESEHQYILKGGADEFENLCYERKPMFHDLFRAPLL